MNTSTSITAPSIPPELAFLSASDRIAFSLAAQKGYVVWNARQQRLRDAYYSWCRIYHHPFVSMQVDGEQACVCLDLATIGRQFEQQGEAFTQFVEAMQEALTWYVASYDSDSWLPGVYTIEGVSISNAPALAQAFLSASERFIKSLPAQ